MKGRCIQNNLEIKVSKDKVWYIILIPPVLFLAFTWSAHLMHLSLKKTNRIRKFCYLFALHFTKKCRKCATEYNPDFKVKHAAQENSQSFILEISPGFLLKLFSNISDFADLSPQFRQCRNTTSLLLNILESLVGCKRDFPIMCQFLIQPLIR